MKSNLVRLCIAFITLALVWSASAFTTPAFADDDGLRIIVTVRTSDPRELRDEVDDLDAVMRATADPEIFEVEHGDPDFDPRRAGRIERRLVRKLAQIDGVRWAIPASEGVQALPFYAWNDDEDDATADGVDVSSYLDLESTHEIARGDGIIVAVLDNGFDLDHPDLAGHMLPGVDIVDGDGDVRPNADGIDDDDDELIDEALGHGTYVSSVLVQVAPGVRVVPIRVLNADGIGSVSDVVRGLEFAIDSGVDVINLSFGTSTDNAALRSVIEQAERAGVLVVGAAGNAGVTVEQFPAAYSEVLAVTAFDTKLDKRARFANHGPWIDVAAPGRALLVADGDGGRTVMSGSSMAAPVVAGQAALMLSTDAGLSHASGVRDRVKKTAKPGGTPTSPALVVDIHASVAMGVPEPDASSTVPVSLPCVDADARFRLDVEDAELDIELEIDNDDLGDDDFEIRSIDLVPLHDQIASFVPGLPTRVNDDRDEIDWEEEEIRVRGSVSMRDFPLDTITTLSTNIGDLEIRICWAHLER